MGRALVSGTSPCVDVLVKAGANLDAKNARKGETPLHMLVLSRLTRQGMMAGRLEAATILVEAGADVQVTNNESLVPHELWPQYGLQCGMRACKWHVPKGEGLGSPPAHQRRWGKRTHAGAAPCHMRDGTRTPPTGRVTELLGCVSGFGSGLGLLRVEAMIV